ncbi:MAG: aspartate aminotransferase family protein [Proteobacteria bacterium]|nr:aspartate aminotransferase family protein [Pseudomonadota bacterium]
MISPVMPTYARADVAFERGVGPYLYTDTGERYLDFGSGIAVTSLGHAHPHLVAALKAQAEKLWHTSNLYRIEGQERLAERLVANSFAEMVFFGNSGAEALECCIKLARKYQDAIGAPDRYRVLTFEGGFHGRTLATLAAGGQQKHLQGFGPIVDGFDHVEWGDVKAARDAVNGQTAAILVEPIEGESGVRMPVKNFLRDLRALADEAGILLMLDEVQTGMGRTGKLFAYEHWGVAPDVAAIAKALGGGFPIGACLATAKAAQGMVAGSHGSTFGGNPLAVAAANAVLDIMLADGFFEHVAAMNKRLVDGVENIARRYQGVIAEVRGLGMLIGMRCVGTNTDLVNALRGRQMLVVPAGDNVVRLLPPLIVDENHVDEALEKLTQACAELAAP